MPSLTGAVAATEGWLCHPGAVGAPCGEQGSGSSHPPSPVEILLPVAAGVLLVGVSAVWLDSGATMVANVMVFLGLGAVLPAHPWRSAALASAPGFLVGLVRAGSDSLGSLLVVVVVTPLIVALAALMVRAGALLVARPDAPPTGEPPPGPGRRRRRFETKEQRGRFLVVLVLLLVVASRAFDAWGAAEADRRAAAREQEMRTALEDRTLQSLRTDYVRSISGADPGLPGGPYDQATLGPEGFTASDEVTVRLQARCVRVEVTADGRVSTEVEDRGC